MSVKIICNQEELSKYLQTVSKALAVKGTLPILTGIYIETITEGARCLATDLEIAIEVYIHNLQVIEPGAVVLPGKTFVEIIKRLPPVPLEIAYEDSSRMVSITSRYSSYQLPVMPVEEFPSLPELKEGESFCVPGEPLKEAIRQTIYATLMDDPRPFLSSILWEITPGQLRLVATDVNRLAIRDLSADSDLQKTVLVPVRSLREIANIFGSTEQNLQITTNDKLLFISGNGITFSSRLVEAQFPRYEQVLPKEFHGTMKVNRLQFIEALERTALVSSTVKFNLTDDGLIINAREPEKGCSKEEIPMDLTGNEIEIGFNLRFLLDFLRSLDSESIICKYIQEQKPFYMQGEGNEEYIYIVMPLKLTT